MALKFWIVKDTRTTRVKKGFVYTTAQLCSLGVTWTDNYELYWHSWHTYNVYAKEVGR